MKRVPDNRRKLFLFVVSIMVFAIKAYVGVILFERNGIAGDMHDYLRESNLIMEQGFFYSEIGHKKNFVAPGFPWLVATLILTFGLKSVIIVNALFSTITLWIVGIIARFYCKRIGQIFVIVWMIFYVHYYIYIGGIYKEPLIQLLVPLSILLSLMVRRRRPIIYTLASSFCFTYLIHTDERYVLLLPIHMLIVSSKNVLGRRDYRNSMIFIISFFILSVPWTIRNYYACDRLVFVTERLQQPLDDLMGRPNDLSIRKSQKREVLTSFKDSLLSGYRPVASFGRQSMVERAIKAGVIPHDFTYVERILNNFHAYWSPVRMKGRLLHDGWKFKESRSLLVNVLYVLNYGILLPFFLIGAWNSLLRRNVEMNLLLGYVFIHSAFHVLVFFGSGRYRSPIDFIIILMAFKGIDIVWKYFRKNVAKYR